MMNIMNLELESGQTTIPHLFPNLVCILNVSSTCVYFCHRRVMRKPNSYFSVANFGTAVCGSIKPQGKIFAALLQLTPEKSNTDI